MKSSRAMGRSGAVWSFRILPAKYCQAHCRYTSRAVGDTRSGSLRADKFEQGRIMQFREGLGGKRMPRARAYGAGGLKRREQILQIKRRQIAFAAGIEFRIGKRHAHGGAGVRAASKSRRVLRARIRPRCARGCRRHSGRSESGIGEEADPACGTAETPSPPCRTRT